MAVNLNPYLNFRGDAADALAFYASVLGGELNVMRFSDMGGMGMPEEEQGLVMHGQLTSPAGTVMAADVPSHMEWAAPDGFSVSLSGGPEEESTLRGYWDGLSDGAEIGMPLNPAPWGDTFGMLKDKFGIHWMVNISGQPQS